MTEWHRSRGVLALVLHNSPERRRKIEKKNKGKVYGAIEIVGRIVINIPMIPYWHNNNSGVSRSNKFYLWRGSFSEAEDEPSPAGNFLSAAGFGPILTMVPDFHSKQLDAKPKVVKWTR